MELLLRTECDNLILYNSDKLIFKADNKFVNATPFCLNTATLDCQ